MDSTLGAAWIGVFGALAGAAISFGATWLVDIRVDKRGLRQQAYDLHREFTSEQMQQTRMLAWKWLRTEPTRVVSEVDHDMNNAMAALHYWTVAGYFQRLSISVKTKTIDEELVEPLFGEYYVWWYLMAFEGRLKHSKWGATEDLRYLYEWMHKRALANDLRMKKWDEWQERVKKDRADYDWYPVSQ